MKISKLFHWLYASLMLLPLVVFGVTGLYYGLNQNAQLSERTEQQPDYYETNKVESTLDFIPNRIYQWNDNFSYVASFDYINIQNNQELFNIYGLPYGENYDTYMAFNSAGLHVIVKDGNNYLITLNVKDMNFMFIFKSIITNNDSYIGRFSSCSYQLVREINEITYTNDISTSIINAWNSTWQNPLFSWSSNSFLIEPFNYITDLFSIPQNNTFSMALSYWLAISIVYLVFDLVMYVPLLAHRWIDKGMVG